MIQLFPFSTEYTQQRSSTLSPYRANQIQCSQLRREGCPPRRAATRPAAAPSPIAHLQSVRQDPVLPLSLRPPAVASCNSDLLSARQAVNISIPLSLEAEPAAMRRSAAQTASAHRPLGGRTLASVIRHITQDLIYGRRQRRNMGKRYLLRSHLAGDDDGVKRAVLPWSGSCPTGAALVSRWESQQLLQSSAPRFPAARPVYPVLLAWQARHLGREAAALWPGQSD
ncbi:hypothetical protein CPLU01_00923 [Colletotrichum plurivorum]|uniref:Uncharacterized protein n=1 Tax=Colletotrichum plurivorum TaxID=2175906 RepID=A0A8H6NQX4_9PEZI|nr:hypothetical protein CPLU01_00923 [Colletotrichum plurivorum]